MEFLYTFMSKTIRILRHARVLAVVAALVTFPAVGNDAIRLPDIGGSDQAALSDQRAESIGQAMLQQLRQRGVILDDPQIAGYIQSLGQRLASHSDAPEQAFTFFVVNDPAINAFAAPGGYIGVHTGLIDASETESELAAVLAHEIAHVTQHHIARTLDMANRMTIPTVAALLAAIALGSQNSEAGAAALAASQAGALQLQIDFTRMHEKEADWVGIQTLARADFDPRAMAVFFERLQTETRYYGRPPEFLSTHPVTTNRISDSRSRAESLPYRQVEDSVAYALVRAKVKVLQAKSPGQLANDLHKRLDAGQYRQEDPMRYALALALRESGRIPEALAEIRELFDRLPENSALRHELALTELAAGNADRALEVYRQGLKIYPYDPVLLPGYGAALLKQGRVTEAHRLLSDFINGNRGDAQSYYLLAQAEERLGNTVESQVALAEYYYRQGDLTAGVQQLELAAKGARGDFYLEERIADRLRRMKAQLEQVMALR